jgi:hypothetical protein
MNAGHYGLAAIVKAREPQVPLWALMLSTQLLDVGFLVLFAAGIEGFQALPGTAGGYGTFIFSADYTHSLAGALAISGTAAAAAGRAWGRRSGLLIGAVVFSHWLLDLLVHHADLPILPGNLGNLPRLGLGLWAFPAVSIFMELALILAGAYLYYRAASRHAALREQRATQAGAASRGYRRQALLTSTLLLLILLWTLAADILGIG